MNESELHSFAAASFAKTDNLRGWDTTSEDDTHDNGMQRYMENDDDEGWN